MALSTLRRRPWAFFALFLALSVPFWIIGASSDSFLPAWIPINLPTAALMTFNPALAASILAYMDGGWPAVRRLLARALDIGRLQRKRWWAPILLLMPAVLALNYGWVVAQGRGPDPAVFPLELVPLLFVMFIVGDLGEELGWQGYAYDPLEARWGALATGLGMGMFWALIHVVPLVEAHRAPLWILWHCSGQVCLRVLHVWIYVNTGRSVLATTLFHTMTNLSEYLIPNYGSSYDPLFTTLVMAALVLVIGGLWSPRTLTRCRLARPSPATAGVDALEERPQ